MPAAPKRRAGAAAGATARAAAAAAGAAVGAAPAGGAEAEAEDAELGSKPDLQGFSFVFGQAPQAASGRRETTENEAPPSLLFGRGWRLGVPDPPLRSAGASGTGAAGLFHGADPPATAAEGEFGSTNTGVPTAATDAPLFRFGPSRRDGPPERQQPGAARGAGERPLTGAAACSTEDAAGSSDVHEARSGPPEPMFRFGLNGGGVPAEPQQASAAEGGSVGGSGPPEPLFRFGASGDSVPQEPQQVWAAGRVVPPADAGEACATGDVLGSIGAHEVPTSATPASSITEESVDGPQSVFLFGQGVTVPVAQALAAPVGNEAGEASGFGSFAVGGCPEAAAAAASASQAAAETPVVAETQPQPVLGAGRSPRGAGRIRQRLLKKPLAAAPLPLAASQAPGAREATAAVGEPAPAGGGPPAAAAALAAAESLAAAEAHAGERRHAEALKACFQCFSLPGFARPLEVAGECVEAWEQAERQRVLGHEDEKKALVAQLMCARERSAKLRQLKERKEAEIADERSRREEAEYIQNELVRENTQLQQQLRAEQRRTAAAVRWAQPGREEVARQVAQLECVPLRHCSDQGREKLKKRILLKWHPDKQPSAEHAALATQVMQELQNRTEWEG